MPLPRTFVGFSSSDILRYYLMCAWKAHEHIDFNFCDCQLTQELRSEEEGYIKQKCRARIGMAGTYLMLIGENTRYKHKYVRWEAEVAIEKGCRIIAANLDKWRFCNPDTCPLVISNIGALFVPFSPQIIAYALENYVMPDPHVGARHYIDSVYKELGYTLFGKLAVRPPKPPPFVASSGR